MDIQGWERTRAGLLAGIFGILSLGAGAVQSGAADPNAKVPVQRMLEAMGGTERLSEVRAVRARSMMYNHHLEQSERPEGPWIVTYVQVNEARDFDKGRLSREEQARSFFYQNDGWSPSSWIFADGVAAGRGRDGRFFPRDAMSAQQAEETLELGPERLGFTALTAPDLHLEADAPYRGHAHAVVAFTWKGNPVRVLISRESGLPSAMELTRPRPESFFWGPWGDVTFRRSYALWTLEPNGVRLPRTVFTEWDGFPVSSQTIDALEINPTLADDAFTFPPEIKSAFSARKASMEDLPLGRPNTPPSEILPGLLQIQGLWNVEIIRQTDGLVILEGPISSGYSARVLAEAERRYPGLKVKAVVTTSDAWPHIGGLREYAARAIPIYALDHNRPILQRLMASPRKMLPDALARAPKPAQISLVSKRVSVGSGPNRFELIPLRTVTGERQMVLWFPESKWLYCSDLFQRDQKGEYFLPQTVSEMVAVVEREGLDVKSAFAMHLPPTPWEEIVAALRKYAPGLLP